MFFAHNSFFVKKSVHFSLRFAMLFFVFSGFVLLHADDTKQGVVAESLIAYSILDTAMPAEDDDCMVDFIQEACVGVEPAFLESPLQGTTLFFVGPGLVYIATAAGACAGQFVAPLAGIMYGAIIGARLIKNKNHGDGGSGKNDEDKKKEQDEKKATDAQAKNAQAARQKLAAEKNQKIKAEAVRKQAQASKNMQDEHKKSWDRHNKRAAQGKKAATSSQKNSSQKNVASQPSKMSALQPQAQTQQGCGDWQQANKTAQILSSPQAEPQGQS